MTSAVNLTGRKQKVPHCGVVREESVDKTTFNFFESRQNYPSALCV